MIAVNNLSVQFTGTNLFDHVTFNINDRDRIGLVGKNGAGKSTLLKILCGRQEPESGTIVIASGQTVGYLPQEMVPDTVGTVIDETLTAFSEIDQLEAELNRLTQQIADRTDYESADYARILNRHTDIVEQINLMGGNSRREQAEKILLGLGFRRDDMQRLVAEFSGGWQMRVELAKLLLRKPDFLLLDEPTNHLDIESIQWLENYLSTYLGAVVLVSHDRTFLDNITHRTIEITAGRIYDYKCSYSEYVVQMQERRASQMAQLTAQQRQVAQIEAFIERFRYKATKSKQVQSRIKMLDRMEAIQVDEVSTESIHFSFPPAPHSGKMVVETEHLGKAYGNHQVFDNVDMRILAKSKVAFVGRNGEGKSTMAKIIVGDLRDFTGVYKPGHQVQIGYYAQNQAAMLDGEKTVFQTIDDVAIGDIRPKIRNILGSFLFDSDDIDKKVKVLSGGEKARLALAKLLLVPSNLLVLDEPTNHLDMDSKDILKNALLQYDGTLIIVSHDRDFLQGLTDTLYEFRDGEVHEFKGDIFEFLDYRKLQSLKELDAKKKTDEVKMNPSAGAPAVSSGKESYQQSKEREREMRKRRSAVEKIEQEIAVLEAKIAEQEAVLASGEAQPADFYSGYEALKRQLDERMLDWEVAVEQLDM
ncbi:MAG: ABC-F family ATP-binding cassette domain-containing protein [Bacteroidales bacterium]|nr:ABC-F family ATP-binding cassette domain-containing protein [Bacteroidales bacterium]